METKNVIYQEFRTEVDRETGEVTNSQNRKLVKLKRTPDFIMLFISL